MRIQKAIHHLKNKGKLPFLVTDLTDIKYVTGFDGSNGYLVIGSDEAVLISDGRYAEYATSILGDGCRFILQKQHPFDAICESMRIVKSDALFFNGSDVSFGFFSKLQEYASGYKLIEGGDEIGLLRMRKEPEELAVIEHAVRITDDCTEHLSRIIKAGMTEWDVSVEIENFYRTHGCRSSSFDSIVASGNGSSMPHYIPSMTKRISDGDTCMIDMGCLYEGYNSDLTRTFFVGRVNEEMRIVYDIVLQAQLKAIAAVRPGITTGDLDAVARSHIENAGFGSMFGHSLGHGVGLSIHEEPSVRKGGDIVLEPGMVITIEPGIYIPGRGGVRIEDIVVVTEDGCRVLTGYPKEMKIIG